MNKRGTRVVFDEFPLDFKKLFLVYYHQVIIVKGTVSMKKSPETVDTTLETLLDLDGEIFPMDNGYWTKFEAYRAALSPQIPHGIRFP